MNDEENQRDLKLLAEIQRGGPAAGKAVERLYLLYAQRFFSFLRGRGMSKEDAENILQTTFVNLMTRSIKTENVSCASAYLWRCVRHAWQDYLRSLSNDPLGDQPQSPQLPEGDFPDLIDILSDGKGAIEDELGLRDCLERMWAKFSKDHEDRATALYLAVVEGWSREHLADYLGRSYGAAREYLSQSRKRFVEYFAMICPDYIPNTN